jgi:PAS domain S-box-containing protein
LRLIRYLMRGYRVAVCTSALAFLITLWVEAWGDRAAFGLFVCAAVVSAYFGGLKAGVLATALASGGLVYQYCLLPPDRPAGATVDFVCSLLLFLIVGFVASYLSNECLRAVSERRRDEREREQAEQYRALAACAPAGLLLFDRGGQCFYANAACQAAGGFSPDEALGSGWTRFIYAEDRGMAADWQASVREARPFTREVRLQDGQGRIRWVVLRADAARAENGRWLGQAATLEDITPRKHLDRELMEQKQLVETLRQGQQELETQTRQRLAVLDADRRALQEQLAGQRQAEEELRRTHAAAQAEWERTEERLRQQLTELARAQEAAREEQARRQREDGDVGKALTERKAEWQRAEGQLRQQLAELTRAQQAAREELEEQRRFEQGLRQQIEALQQAHRSAQEELTEWQKEEENLRRALSQGAAERQRAEEKLRREAAEASRATEGARQQLEESQRREQGLRQQHQELQAALQRANDDIRRQQQAAAEAAAKYAGERRQADEERARWQSRLQEAARRAESIRDCLSERLQPALDGLREALARHEPAAVLEQPLRRLTSVLDSLAVARRIARDDLPLHKQPVELSAILDRAVEVACPLLHERGHHLTLALPLVPEWLDADADRLEQALLQLLDNAACYTEPGGELRLTAEREQDELVFRVRDSGRGISAEELPGLMELNARRQRFREGGDGLGIGLALARGLVELHGGTLSATSGGPGQGSEFVVRLPALLAEPPREEVPVPELAETAANGSGNKNGQAHG